MDNNITFVSNNLSYLKCIIFSNEIALGNPEVMGKIKSFCRSKGHGFIIPEDGNENLFVHISEWVATINFDVWITFSSENLK